MILNSKFEMILNSKFGIRNSELILSSRNRRLFPKTKTSLRDLLLGAFRKFRLWQGKTVGAIHESPEGTPHPSRNKALSLDTFPHRGRLICHPEIADFFRRCRVSLRDLLPRTACKLRRWQTRVPFVAILEKA